jgi:hypothetical protein
LLKMEVTMRISVKNWSNNVEVSLFVISLKLKFKPCTSSLVPTTHIW